MCVSVCAFASAWGHADGVQSSVPERGEDQSDPDWAALSALGRASDVQQSLISSCHDKGASAYNWGYDP